MNSYEIENFLSLKRHIVAIACGIIGGSLPNDKSNIHPFITCGILSGLIVKLLFGDYDEITNFK